MYKIMFVALAFPILGQCQKSKTLTTAQLSVEVASLKQETARHMKTIDSLTKALAGSTSQVNGVVLNLQQNVAAMNKSISVVPTLQERVNKIFTLADSTALGRGLVLSPDRKVLQIDLEKLKTDLGLGDVEAKINNLDMLLKKPQ